MHFGHLSVIFSGHFSSTLPRHAESACFLIPTLSDCKGSFERDNNDNFVVIAVAVKMGPKPILMMYTDDKKTLVAMLLFQYLVAVIFIVVPQERVFKLPTFSGLSFTD